ncbi:MAG: tyrosine-type recombinase/integrase [Bradyrhizobium sp.]|uniref:tyrosine-type recombinase/integrase n=1 Tax=Bradyrhizobium sp. TaxID=376 RepID=UPI001C29A342|nr:integrase arm-type DNA-binding domain-containing protein [Bradyrhizobium sp.]MBU6463871.1 tyrosine-type recombinase/integrase [Pseudomonadota bacterium]MDE2065883.1 tyrosine-type recombinase/integrase [Bradyrhizobium sp.]MDE2468991.1 tyrosine-type recombinase/integrase [Bradyrhizobium sp.]
MAGKLKPLDVQREIRPGKYPDGDGLYLIVAGATSKNWSYRYWKNGKQRWLGLGSFKDVSLKDARLARDAARLRIKGDRSTPGVDIVQEKRAARQEAKAIEIKITLPTFEECAEIYIRERWSTWSRKHRNQWPSSLKRYAYPTIGKLTIREIRPSHVYELLRPIWLEKRETANRVRGRIETIIAKNVDVDDTDFRNPAELTKQLREKLPRRPKRVVRHHPALPYAEAPQFMADLSLAGGIAASMLRFLIFSACRTNEVVEARWSEIDGRSSTWKIPGERMKMNQDHVVPLSDPALAILEKLRDGAKGALIFPNPDGGLFSENAMLAVLNRLGFNHVTVHGFRSTFATWAEECTDYPDGVREAALAHKYKSETTAAYQRGHKLEKRRALMKDWAQFLAGSEIIRLSGAG